MLRSEKDTKRQKNGCSKPVDNEDAEGSDIYQYFPTDDLVALTHGRPAVGLQDSCKQKDDRHWTRIRGPLEH